MRPTIHRLSLRHAVWKCWSGSCGSLVRAKAAEGLEREAAVPSRTLASLEWAWSQGRDLLHGGSVLLVDEAGMIDVRQLGRVLDHAEQRHAKVILLGDPDQLKSIGAGDAYRGLLEQHESASIESIRRQTDAMNPIGGSRRTSVD